MEGLVTDGVGVGTGADSAAGGVEGDLALAELATHIPCQWSCPAMTRVPDYISAIHGGDYEEAARINRDDILFPGILGRICSRPCEDTCRHGREGLGAPVSICHLKRAAMDLLAEPLSPPAPAAESSGKRVAVVGGGPAGLAVAHHLARFGHGATIFEEQSELGGMLAAAIPAFRLPPALRRQEIAALVGERFEVRTGVRVGRDLSLDELRSSHDAVVLALGCQRSRRLGVPGEDGERCYDGLEFLGAANRGAPLDVGESAIVIGGGFTAADCARMARRLGARDVRVVVRREREDLSLRAAELEELDEEGVALRERLQPREIQVVDGRAVVTFDRMTVRRDMDGVRRAIARAGETVELTADCVILAVGQELVPFEGAPAVSDAGGGVTALDGVFAVGDHALGPRTVVDAVGHGYRVATAVDDYLSGGPRVRRVLRERPAGRTPRLRDWDELPPVPMPTLSVPGRLSTVDAEVETGHNAPCAAEEARRCYLCHLIYRIDVDRCVFCDKCVEICPQRCIAVTLDGEPADCSLGRALLRALRFWHRGERSIVIDPGPCIRCGLCVDVCPTRCIPVTRLELREDFAKPA